MSVTKETLKDLQRNMKALGFYTGLIDGSWGPLSHGAFTNVRRAVVGKKSAPEGMTPLLFAYCKATAWSTKVSDRFVTRVNEIATLLQLGTQGPDQLMACMAFETGETFSPSIKNGAGAPYYGLIQFGEAAAKDVGTTTAKLVKMSAEEQLEYVYKFFKPYAGKLKTTSDIYARIIWPVAVGKAEDYVIFSEKKPGKAYIQNRGLDVNRDGLITKAECAAKVEQKLVLGLHPSNLRINAA